MIFNKEQEEPVKAKLDTNHIEVKTFVNTPIIKFEIPYFKHKSNFNWFAKMFKKDVTPKSRMFTLYKIRLINMGRFAEIAYQIPDLAPTFKTNSEFIEYVYPLIKNHRAQLVYLCAICLYNQHSEPPQELIDFLDENIEADMLFEIIYKGVDQEDLMSFMNATMLVKGTSINFARAEDVLPVSTQE